MKRVISCICLLLVCANVSAIEFEFPLRCNFIVTSELNDRGMLKIGESSSWDVIHKGVDLAPMEHNAPVYAAADGVVITHYPACYGGHPTYGVCVVIKHADGYYTLYAHMDSTAVREGLEVKKGDFIGRTGNTGVSTGEHLHFEILLDPLLLLNFNTMEW